MTGFPNAHSNFNNMKRSDNYVSNQKRRCFKDACRYGNFLSILLALALLFTPALALAQVFEYQGGPLNELGSWSNDPASFTADNQTFVIGQEAANTADWTVGGEGTVLSINTSADIAFIAGTTVTFDGITIEFTENAGGDLLAESNIVVVGGVEWEYAEPNNIWSFESEGPGSQVISADDDSYFLAYDFFVERLQENSDDVFELHSLNGEETLVLFAMNDFLSRFMANALFVDNGSIYAVGNLAGFQGPGAQYELTGHLLLADLGLLPDLPDVPLLPDRPDQSGTGSLILPDKPDQAADEVGGIAFTYMQPTATNVAFDLFLLPDLESELDVPFGSFALSEEDAIEESGVLTFVEQMPIFVFKQDADGPGGSAAIADLMWLLPGEEPVSEFVEYGSIAELLANAEFGEEARLTNEVIVTFVAPNFRNQHYLSDETGAVLVDDDGGVLSGLSRGDGIVDFTFTFSQHNNNIQLLPLFDIEPSSSGNDLPYWETTLADLEYVGEPRLMRVERVQFLQEGDFVRSRNYGIVDPTVTDPITFRTHLGDSDVIGQPIPVGRVNLVGIAAQFQGNPQLYAAHYDLIEPLPEEFTVTFNVDMGFADDFNPETQDVFMSGEMFGWDEPGSNPDAKMEPLSEGSSIYTLTLELEAGDYAYKYFLVANDTPSWDNGEWPGDPNRVVTVTGDMVVNDLFSIQPGDEPFTDVLSIAALRDGVTDGSVVYRLNSEAVLTAQRDTRNQKWIQDATGAVLIDDNAGTITTEFNIGDGITGLIGTLTVFQGMMQFVPQSDPGEPSSTDNEIVPFDITLGELSAADQSRLVRIQNVILTSTADQFANSVNYPLTDITGTGVMRTWFADTDIPDQPMLNYVDVVAIVGLFNNNPQLYPRMYADLTEVTPEIAEFGLVFPEDDFDLVLEGSGDTEVVIEWEEATSDFPVTYVFHIDAVGDDFSEPIVSIPSDNDGTATTLTITFDDLDELLDDLGVEVGQTGSVDWTVTAHIGVDIVEFAQDIFTLNIQRGVVEFVPYSTLFQFSVLDGNLPEWFGSATERGMAAHDDKVYVVSRKGGIFVYVLDAETGEIIDSLNTEGISGGTFALNDIEVSGDGRIYAGNMSMGAEQTFKLYELHPTMAPRVVLEFPHVDNARIGDKLTMVGNWFDGGLTLYAGDGSNARVFKFEMNGSQNGQLFGAPTVIDLEVVASGATPIVAPLADGSFFWTASGRNVHFFEADGTHVGEIPGSVVAGSSTALRYLGMEGDDHMLAVYQHGNSSPMGENENIRVVRIPDGDLASASIDFVTPSMRGAGNGNGTGKVAMVPVDDGSANLFVLGTDNGIAGYHAFELDLEFPDYSADLEIMPIAQARNFPDDRFALVKGIVNSPDHGFGVADYFIQDETGGINVTDFVEGGAQKGQVVEPGDSIIIMGEIATFRNQRNIEVADYQIVNRGNPLPEPVVITSADMRADSEYQGMRVQLRNMYIIEQDIAIWPEDGASSGSGVNIRITSEESPDTLVMRLARNNTAFGEGAGQPLPPPVFHVSGTMAQFNDVTQLFPFFADDIVPAAEIQWANLQWPPQGEIKEGEEFMVYAQIYSEGITDASDQESDDIKAWFGVNTANVAPWEEGWTWIEADFNSEHSSNNHEYMADIGSGLSEGLYYYVSRFQLMDFDYVYGGFQGGFWDGENNVSGQLTVAKETSADLADIPKEFGIDQNFPNPFNPSTNIRYAVPQTAHVTINVYSITGQLVATLVDETRDAGYHNVAFDATRLASGMYIYRMQAGDFAKTRKLMLIK